jgi:hypothetical protein
LTRGCGIHCQRQGLTKRDTRDPEDENYAQHVNFCHSSLYRKRLTLADVEIMASNALKSNSPNRLTAAMIAGYVFMSNVFINVIRKFKEGRLILQANASLTEIIVWLYF